MECRYAIIFRHHYLPWKFKIIYGNIYKLKAFDKCIIKNIVQYTRMTFEKNIMKKIAIPQILSI